MVCDGAMVASSIISVMMNGMCCAWQMHEEDDRRDAIRKDIRLEYMRQRLIEQEIWDQRTMDEYYNNSDSSIRDERRRQLMRQKMSLEDQFGLQRGDYETGKLERKEQHPLSSGKKETNPRSELYQSKSLMDQRTRSLPLPSSSGDKWHQFQNAANQERHPNLGAKDNLSLADLDDFDDDDDSIFVDIALR